MKYLLLFFLLPNLFANLSTITGAISKGDTMVLSQYFDESVEIAILDDENIYNKNEAIEAMKGFFATYTPKAFSQVHKGSSPGNSEYCIGNLVTDKATFRVYIYLAKKGDATIIQELRFDKGQK